MMVVVMGMYNHHNLRLRRKWQCETEEESESEQYLFHASVWRASGRNTELL